MHEASKADFRQEVPSAPTKSRKEIGAGGRVGPRG